MAVIYFQAAIVLSIVASYLVAKRLGVQRPGRIMLYVAAAWTIETFLLVRTNPLTFVQLAVIWATYFLARKYLALYSENKRLQEILSDSTADLSKYTQGQIYQFIEGRKNFEIVAGEGHRPLLNEAIESCHRDLIITSGWLADWVVTPKLTAKLEKSLKRGAKIALIFGHQSGSLAPNLFDAQQRALVPLLRISKAAENYAGSLDLIDLNTPQDAAFGNHTKVLICDDRFVVCGSNNWLSNKRFSNAELSIKISDPTLVHEMREEVWNLVHRSLGTSRI